VDAAALPLGRGYFGHAVGLAGALRFCAPSFLPVLAADAYQAGLLTIAGAALQLLTTDISARPTDIRAPTLIVWGEHDRLVRPSIGEQLHRVLPGSRLEVIASAGHNPMWDRPHEFNRPALEFLRGAEER
jgi:pimeloyl-ACP methyl ester carboxylesterase